MVALWEKNLERFGLILRDCDIADRHDIYLTYNIHLSDDITLRQLVFVFLLEGLKLHPSGQKQGSKCRLGT